jgi:hypothetical protein
MRPREARSILFGDSRWRTMLRKKIDAPPQQSINPPEQDG